MALIWMDDYTPVHRCKYWFCNGDKEVPIMAIVTLEENNVQES